MRIALAVSILALLACGKVTESGGGSAVDGGGGRVSCSTDADCPLDQPVCDTNEGLCRGCEASSECSARLGNAECETSSGACVACIEDVQCLSSSAPICDQEGYVCRGCALDSECDSGLCDQETATCANSSNVVYVDNSAGNVLPGCGSQAQPCGGLADGFTKAGGIPINAEGERRYVVVVPSSTPYAGDVNPYQAPASTYISAVGAEFDLDFRFEAINEGVVWIGGTFSGGVSAGQTLPISCSSGGQLRVVGVDISSHGIGVSATDECDIEIFDSTFDDNATALSINGAGSAQIERNLLRGTLGRAIFIQGTDGVIRNNLLADNGFDGQISTISANPGVGENVLIAYNTLVGNLSDESGAITCGGSGGTTTVTSNIVFQNDAAVDCPQAGQTVVGNILEVPGGDPLLTNNSNQPPQFVNAGEDDYRLAPTSPAIDQGDVSAASPLDVAGNPRPVGMGPDIGAYERQ
ncbi:MAG: right-handed parallel beta-helix repeat-containing protein [Deltaproteobacteria bacterium]|nr:right-handed parallel beta-helix repeat-containing protein [Deltaproteobacteria bacterium]